MSSLIWAAKNCEGNSVEAENSGGWDWVIQLMISLMHVESPVNLCQRSIKEITFNGGCEGNKKFGTFLNLSLTCEKHEIWY